MINNIALGIGRRLEFERKRLKLSAASLGALAGVTGSTILRRERGRQMPPGFHLNALAEAGADIVYIVSAYRHSAPKSLINYDENYRTISHALARLTPDDRRLLLVNLIDAEMRG